MENKVQNIAKDPEYLDYLESQMYVIEDLSYFNNIRKYPSESFLLGIYNYVNVLREHNMHLGVILSKAPYKKCSKEIVKVLHLNLETSEDGKFESKSDQFEKFLNQFKQKTYSDGYYKKFASLMPVDKLCNDLCHTVLEKSWVHVLASMAAFQYLNSVINIKLNEFAIKSRNNDAVLLDESNENGVALLRLLDDEDRTEVKTGINDAITAFCLFFNEIDNLYYND